MTAPRFRVWRHTLFILCIALISFNQAFSVFGEYISETEVICNIGFCVLISYLAVAYFGLYVLVPRYLQTNRLNLFIVLLLGAIALRAFLQEGMEYTLLRSFSAYIAGHTKESQTITLFSKFVMDAICIIGVFTAVFFKIWMDDDLRISQLENRQVQFEVERLKERIDPVFLFNTLNLAGNQAKTDKEKASYTLMELSAILRYRLYDSAKGNIFLNTETSFIRSYLELQQSYHNKLNYSISEHGDMRQILVPPLLFVPPVQIAINESLSIDADCSIAIEFHVDNTALTFLCRLDAGSTSVNMQRLAIEQQLVILYPSKYNLTVGKNEIRLLLYTS